MRYSLLFSLLLLAGVISARTKPVIFKSAGATIILLDSASAATVSARPDDYAAMHSQFDREVRLHKQGATMQDYLNASAGNVRTWSAGEEQQLKAAYSSIDSFSRASGIALHLPDTVLMIKTTAAEEFGAEGWTRGNRIMLNTGAQPISLHLLAHELWHVISRKNPALRDRAYAVFHFQPCDNIDYKAAVPGAITNPDCPRLEHYVSLSKNGKEQPMALLLYSGKAYNKDFSFDDISLGLLALDATYKPVIEDGQAVIYELEAVPDLFQKIGMNTQYTLHPEEITAEHFAAMIQGKTLPQPIYLEGVRKAFAQ